MKAEEPGDRVPIVKYGMGAEYQDAIVERHAAVTQERRAIADLHFAYALHVGPALRAALDRIGKRLPESSPPVACAVEPETAAPDDLRRSLGLG